MDVQSGAGVLEAGRRNEAASDCHPERSEGSCSTRVLRSLALSGWLLSLGLTSLTSLPPCRPAASPLPRCPAARYLPTVNPTATLLAAASLWTACGGEPDLAAGNPPAVSRGLRSVSVLRIPREGGVARLYRVPALDSAAWKLADKLPPLERPIGADAEQGLVFAARPQEQRGRARPRHPPGPHLPRECPLRHPGPRRRALRGGHRQRRDPAGAAHSGALPLQAAGQADASCTAPWTARWSPGSAATSPALEFLGSDQAPTSTPRPPRGRWPPSFLGRPGGRGGRHRRRALRRRATSRSRDGLDPGLG